MQRYREGELGFTDDRVFHLLGYRHGHGYALLRGYPEPVGDAPVHTVEDLEAATVFFRLARITETARSVEDF